MDVVLIPAYKPDKELIKLVEELHSEGLQILIVDDGSGKEYEDIFKIVSEMAVVIHSPKNEGKGNALKRGMEAIRKYYPDCSNFITTDADGQHKIQDILSVKNKLDNGSTMVLTVRNFKGNIPTRSMFGNLLSRWIYTIITGHYLPDNQSGLRGFSSEHIEWLLEVPGSKYDYEINVIFYADKQHIRIATVPIEAIYIDGNKSSHFNPVKDTIRIYKRLFSSARASIMSIVICIVALIIISILFGYRYCAVSIPVLGFAVSMFSVLLNKYIFRNIKYRDAGRMFLYTAIRFTVYTFVCQCAERFCPKLPLAVVVLIMALIMIPIKYNVHKYIRHKE